METKQFTKEELDLMKKTILKGVEKDNIEIFLYYAKTYDLNPLTKEIIPLVNSKGIKEKDPNTGKWETTAYEQVITPLVTRDTYLKIANNRPDFEGIVSFVVRAGDHFSIDSSTDTVVHKFGPEHANKPIIGAWAKLSMKGKKPFITYVPFSEYNTGKSVWYSNPSAMIQKVAEVFVLKRGCGIQGLVTEEEMMKNYPELESGMEEQQGGQSQTVNQKPDVKQPEASSAKDESKKVDSSEPELLSKTFDVTKYTLKDDVEVPFITMIVMDGEQKKRLYLKKQELFPVITQHEANEKFKLSAKVSDAGQNKYILEEIA